MLSKDLFEPKQIGWFGPLSQVAVVTVLFSALTLQYYINAKAIGNVGPASTFAVSLLFVPIYEEILFRGIILGFFENAVSKVRAVAIVSLLFGLWHIKNIFWFSPEFVLRQVAYTALIFSPIACVLTLRFRSIWPAVILHFINNLIF